MSNCNEMMHKSDVPAGVHPLIVEHPRCADAVAIEKEIPALMWRAGEQRERE